jgi:hypothetical protein
MQQTYKTTEYSRQSAWLFLQSSELGSPTPLTDRRECPALFDSGGGGGRGAHLLAGEGLGVPIHEWTDTEVL